MKVIIIVVGDEDETAHVTHVEVNGKGYGHMLYSGQVHEIELTKGDSIDIIHSDE